MSGAVLEAEPRSRPGSSPPTVHTKVLTSESATDRLRVLLIPGVVRCGRPHGARLPDPQSMPGLLDRTRSGSRHGNRRSPRDSVVEGVCALRSPKQPVPRVTVGGAEDADQLAELYEAGGSGPLDLPIP
jgi:hypothetical protein